MWSVPRVDRLGRLPARLPAVALLVVYVVLLLGIPSQLVVGSLGAAGAPAGLVGVLALFWWTCAVLGGQGPTRAAVPVRAAAGLLVAAVLASYANGMATGWWAPSSIRQSTDQIYSLVAPSVAEVAGAMVRAADRGLLTGAAWLGVLLLCSEGLRSWADVDRLLAWLVGAATVVAAVAVVQFFTGASIAGLYHVPGLRMNADFGAVASRSVLNRASATAIHPIELGVVLAGVLPLALHHTIYRWGRRLALLPTVLVVLAVVMSVSRSAVLVAAVALGVMAAGWPSSWRRRALWIVPVSVVALRAAVPGLVGTVVSLFRNAASDPSVTGRTDDYAVVLQLLAQHPVLGRGLFTFQPRYYRILDNQFLTAALELGYVGLGAVVVLVLVGTGCARVVRCSASGARERHLGLALSGSILGTSLSWLTFDAWSFPMAAGTSFLLLGLAGAAWRLTREDLAGRPAEADAARSTAGTAAGPARLVGAGR